MSTELTLAQTEMICEDKQILSQQPNCKTAQQVYKYYSK